MNVLYVEDEVFMSMVVSESLRINGFDVAHFKNPTDALLHFHHADTDIVIMDIMLPEMSGIKLAEYIKRIAPHIPVIFVTAKTEISDLAEGFAIGANDYLRKPFIIEELLLRMRALLKMPLVKDVHVFGEFELDYSRQKLKRLGLVKKLSYRECEILQQLILNRGKVITREKILENSINNKADSAGRSLDVFISKLRGYLKDDPRIRIEAVKKIGYKLVVEA